MATATAAPDLTRKLLDYLVEKDGALYVSDLPPDLGDAKVLGKAWAAGLVEFGRRNHCFHPVAAFDGRGGAQPDSDGKPQLTAILDDGMSWTGPKKNCHKPIRDLLAEDGSLPTVVYKQEKVKDERTDKYSIVKTKVEGKPLRLQVRITDKGFGTLAE